VYILYCLTGTNADIIKAGGYKLSALEIESVIIEASCYHFSSYGCGLFLLTNPYIAV
jgi:hypothetical protein